MDEIVFIISVQSFWGFRPFFQKGSEPDPNNKKIPPKRNFHWY